MFMLNTFYAMDNPRTSAIIMLAVVFCFAQHTTTRVYILNFSDRLHFYNHTTITCSSQQHITKRICIYNKPYGRSSFSINRKIICLHNFQIYYFPLFATHRFGSIQRRRFRQSRVFLHRRRLRGHYQLYRTVIRLGCVRYSRSGMRRCETEAARVVQVIFWLYISLHLPSQLMCFQQDVMR